MEIVTAAAAAAAAVAVALAPAAAAPGGGACWMGFGVLSLIPSGPVHGIQCACCGVGDGGGAGGGALLCRVCVSARERSRRHPSRPSPGLICPAGPPPGVSQSTVARARRLRGHLLHVLARAARLWLCLEPAFDLMRPIVPHSGAAQPAVSPLPRNSLARRAACDEGLQVKELEPSTLGPSQSSHEILSHH